MFRLLYYHYIHRSSVYYYYQKLQKESQLVWCNGYGACAQCANFVLTLTPICPLSHQVSRPRLTIEAACTLHVLHQLSRGNGKFNSNLSPVAEFDLVNTEIRLEECIGLQDANVKQIVQFSYFKLDNFREYFNRDDLHQV